MKVRIRQLKNGKWVGEIKGWFGWRAVDVRDSRYTHAAGSYYYRDCFADSEEAIEKAMREHMARQGI